MTHRLFIAEKPSVGRAIASALGVASRHEGYICTRGGDTVTWCFGHMLEPAPPDAYLGKEVPFTSNGKTRQWRVQDLPVVPGVWKYLPSSAGRKQLKLIGSLLKKSRVAVNCGDPDREGQLLVDEVLEHFAFQGQVLRYWASAQDDTSVKNSLSALRSNGKYRGMMQAARGRQHADWLIGMNLTRAWTLAARRCGLKDLITVGRVQTPVLNLVAARDREISGFRPVRFFKIEAGMELKGSKGQGGASFTAELDRECLAGFKDEAGHLTSERAAEQAAEALEQAGAGKIFEVITKDTPQDPPLPPSLSELQLTAGSRWGYSAAKTLELCQSLYEKHRLISYPRTDSGFLPLAQWGESSQVLNAVAATLPPLGGLTLSVNTGLRSRAWNDLKVTAHHGIIPTRQRGNVSALSPDELRIYDLICRLYIAQFLPRCVIRTVQARIDVPDAGLVLSASGRTVLKAGFLSATGSGGVQDAAGGGSDSGCQDLPPFCRGDMVAISRVEVRQMKTKAPPAYTEGTLIKAMENIAATVEDPEARKLLKEGDGLGTAATRAAIIEELKRKGYLQVVKKHLRCTDAGLRLLRHLPPQLKDPVLTAQFERHLREIEAGQLSLNDFEGKFILPFIRDHIKKAAAARIVPD